MLGSIKKFRNWAKTISTANRSGEWECDYTEWSEICTQISKFLDSTNYLLWTECEIFELLYIIGRDNESQYIAGLIAEQTDRLIWLLTQCLNSKESEAKWQLIAEAGELPVWDDELGELIYRLYFDKSHYVQRRALMELGKKKSKYTLEVAEYSWGTGDEYQRISVLQALHDLSYERIFDFLAVALKSGKEHLILSAERIHEERGKLNLPFR